jgi:hypothetical protein
MAAAADSSKRWLLGWPEPPKGQTVAFGVADHPKGHVINKTKILLLYYIIFIYFKNNK